MRINILFLLACFTIAPLNATKIYNLTGSTELSTFVEGLKHNRSESVIVNLSQGIYYLDKPLRFNVEHIAPITFVGHGKVVISGAEPLTNWQTMPNGLWRTKMPVNSDIHQLIVDGKLAILAKSPNVGAYYLKEGSLVTKDGKNVEYRISLPDEAKKELVTLNEKETPVVNLLRLFTHSKSQIKDYSAKEGTLSFIEPYTHSYFKPDNKTRIILDNYYAALDVPGEWYQDVDGFVYYMPHKGECISRTHISFAKLNNLVTVSGIPGKLAGNITFKNTIFEGCDVKGCSEGIAPYQSAYTLAGAVLAIYAKKVNFENCEFRGLGGYAIWLMENCEDCALKSNYIHDIGGGGIKIGGLKINQENTSKNIIVENNIIHSFGRDYMGATGIFLTYAHHCDITHNDISNGCHTGISVGFSWGYGETPTHENKITYNRITNLGKGMLNDFAGIYTLGVSPGTVIKNNVIYGMKSSGSGTYGIYTDEGSSNILIENNLAYDCTGGGFHQHYGSNNIVRNNIFAHGDKSNIVISVIRKPEDVQLTFEKNIVVVTAGDAISGEVLDNGKFVFRDNCFYNEKGGNLTVNGHALRTWMERKKSTYVINNPRIRNHSKGDYVIQNKELCREIGFVSFDYSKAGVYGNLKWRRLADKLIKISR